MKKVIVKLENFSKSYNNKEIIKDINLEVYEGEFLTLLGSSGCGKTTILRSISGLDFPTKGKVYIDGEDITALEPQERKVNTIFQNYALFPLMTVYDNIAFGLKMKKVPKKEIAIRVKEMIELVHLEGFEQSKPGDLSGGQQQRVSIARALINKPRVLLLDEPLSALDQKLRGEMQLELKGLQKKLGITFIYVTHDQNEALSMSDRIAVIHNKKILQIDAPAEIYEHPKNLYVAKFLGDSNIFTGIVKEIKGQSCMVLTEDKTQIYTKNNEFNVGDKVSIVIRPENIKITKSERLKNCLEGVITDMVYDGSFTKIMVKVKKQIITVVIFGNDKKYAEKEKIFLYWDTEDPIVLRDEND